MQEEWRLFLEQQSANIVDDLVEDFGNPAAEGSEARNGNSLYDLGQLDVLAISGSDARDFLHGQLSSDISALAEDQFQLSSWCNIKGRVIAVFIIYQSHDCYYLLLEKELREQIQKRLQMFVMRSDVSITLASDQLVRMGIGGKDLHDKFRKLPETGSTGEPAIMLNLPGSLPRSLVLCTTEQAKSLWQQFSEQARPVASRYWLEHDINAGIPWPGKAGSENFLPQSLNLDLLGGLSFNKGCYPGQEIISRMHFRGKLKQRMQLLTVTTDKLPVSGTNIYSNEGKQHCGTLVRACAVDENSYLLLACLDIEQQDAVDLFLAEQDGPRLEILQLPYDISGSKS